MHYLAQMRLFCLGPLCVQLVLKVTSSHTDSNAYTLLQPSPEIQTFSWTPQEVAHGCLEDKGSPGARSSDE